MNSWQRLARYWVKIIIFPLALLSSFNVANAYEILHSQTPERAAASTLDGATVMGDMYVFIDQDSGVNQAIFSIDGVVTQTENIAPWDLAGTEKNDNSKAYDTMQLSDGPHTVSVLLQLSGGSSEVVSANIVVTNNGAAIWVNPDAVNFQALSVGEIFSANIDVIESTGAFSTFFIASNDSWLTLDTVTGVTPQTVNFTVDSTGLTEGLHETLISIDSIGYPTVIIPVTLIIGDAASHQLMFSVNANRSSPVILEGQTLSGNTYIFTTPDMDVQQVRFYLDDPSLAGSPIQIENNAPYDFAGTSGSNGKPFDVDDLIQGLHTVTAEIIKVDGATTYVSGTFMVQSIETFITSPNSLNFNLTEPEVFANSTINIDHSSGVATQFNVSSSDSWLTVDTLTGTTPTLLNISADVTGLLPGSYNGQLTIQNTSGSSSIIVPVGLIYSSSQAFVLTPSSIDQLMESTDPVENVSVLLTLDTTDDGQSIAFDAISDVAWAMVSPSSGLAPEILLVSFDPFGLATGVYNGKITVSRTDEGASEEILLKLTVGEVQSALVVNPTSLDFSVALNSGEHTGSFTLSASDDSNVIFTEQTNQPWLSIDGSSGVTPETLTVRIDTTGLAQGNYQALIDISANGQLPAQMNVNLEVTAIDPCAPVICSEIRVDLPFKLDFNIDSGGLLDQYGEGTGFTYILPSTEANAYQPANITLDTNAGVLRLDSTAGILHLANNDQVNAIGVGFPGPNQITQISTQINQPVPGTGKYEQAGLWFGYDEDNYVKLVYISTPSGQQIQFAHESNGDFVQSFNQSLVDLSASQISFILTADPNTLIVTASYSTDGLNFSTLGNITVSPEFFSFDAAGIDPVIGTRSFTGLFSTHRNSSISNQYEFEYFNVEVGSSLPNDDELNFSFSKSSHPLSFPTSMAWAPDGKLYVSELFGSIHALSYDENLSVISDEVITSLVDTLGPRLTLGLTVRHDNPADNNDYSLWISSSSPSVNEGVANSGAITRLSGINFGTVEQVITGLPRAKANHATNRLHFGLDNRLYMAVGGNTGAGSPVDVITEFGDMQEQPLSSAIIVADVFAPGFDGSCHNSEDIFADPPCDVATYATGLRNSYDFVIHSNGNMYATDNGLGVTGAFPPSPFPDCSGLSDARLVADGGNNPGVQPDELMLIMEGKYYGHPNPSREECIFKDGSLQGVSPLSNYEPPISNLGEHASANGIIEYTSSRGCGKLEHSLLTTRYSLGDDVLRIKLTGDGLGVQTQDSLITGLNDPLTLSEKGGNLFVAEFGSGQISAFKYQPEPCWSDLADMPLAILDSASAGKDNIMYVVGGKTVAGHVNNSYIYDLTDDSWTQFADKPGAAVENAAMVYHNNRLYVFGGSTAAFSGAVAESWYYDLGSNVWVALPDMPNAVGGVSAEVINGKIYVAGGMNGSGVSVNTLQVFDTIMEQWSFGPNMSEFRDNPGTVVVEGQLYILGGRHRDVSGLSIVDGHTSVEIFNPVDNSWSFGAAMPRGRRTFVVGSMSEKIQIIGGEVNGEIPQEIDEFDPVTGVWTTKGTAPSPKHGAAFHTVGKKIIVSGGGAVSGASFTDSSQLGIFE
ncbi:MAG: PQQ-dependent sugar dehydrogenase [Pseudomonadales bacterium]|nr:PQQ-dependent sugar dehydrogenase [Pseudomonadales bacterium]